MNRLTLTVPHVGVCIRTAKKCFHYAEAAKVAMLLRRHHDSNHHPYRCEACEWWHVGSSERAGRAVPMRSRRRAKQYGNNRGVAA